MMFIYDHWYSILCGLLVGTLVLRMIHDILFPKDEE